MNNSQIKIQDVIKEEFVKVAKDFVYGIKKYLYVEHPKRGKILFNLFPFQEDVVRDIQKHRFVIIGKSRQMGISTLMAAYALLMMLFNSNYKVLVIATKQTVAANLVRKVKVMYNNCPSWLRGHKKLVADNAMSLELWNGSSIKAESSSGSSGRSEAISLLVIDEAAFIDNFEELWTASQMTLATGGDAVVLSTPNGVGNLFHKLFTQAESGKHPDGFEGMEMFYPIRLPWYLHPERDQKWRDQQDVLLGKRNAAQECVWGKSLVTVRNKITGEIKQITIEDLNQELKC